MKSLIFLFLLACACAPSKGDKNTGTVSLPSNEKQVISDEVCPTGKTLQYQESNDSSISTLTPAIAIVSGDGSCALTGDVNDEWINFSGKKSYFKVNAPDCIRNNSIWKVESANHHNNIVSFRYINFENNQFFYMNGTDDVETTYARDHAGIRVLICK